MNRRGFTLVELISVIALLGIIAIIIGVNVTKSSENAKKSLLKTKIQNIETAAVTYGQDNRENFTKVCNEDGEPCNGISNCYCYNEDITVSILLNAGVLNADQDSDDIINPLNNESLSDEEIIIYQKYNKIYAYAKNANNLLEVDD